MTVTARASGSVRASERQLDVGDLLCQEQACGNATEAQGLVEPSNSFVQGVHDDESGSDRLCRVDDPLQRVGDRDRSQALPPQRLRQGEASQQDCRNLYRTATPALLGTSSRATL